MVIDPVIFQEIVTQKSPVWPLELSNNPIWRRFSTTTVYYLGHVVLQVPRMSRQAGIFRAQPGVIRVDIVYRTQPVPKLKHHTYFVLIPFGIIFLPF